MYNSSNVLISLCEMLCEAIDIIQKQEEILLMNGIEITTDSFIARKNGLKEKFESFIGG